MVAPSTFILIVHLAVAGAPPSALDCPRATALVRETEAKILEDKLALVRLPLELDEVTRVQRTLLHLERTDQIWQLPFLERAVAMPTDDERACAARYQEREMMRTFRANLADLVPLIERHGWISPKVFGEQAERVAWLIVQHADFDVTLQERVLAAMTERLASGHATAKHQAFLFDRVQKNRGRPQRYGTQDGGCSGDRWQPYRLEDAARVDDARRRAGMEPLATYVDTMTRLNCTSAAVDAGAARPASPAPR